MIKRLSKKIFNKIYSNVPRLCIDLIIMNDKGVVLAKRDIPPCKGMWHIPGGTLLLGENINKCAERVAKCETGLKIKIKKLFGIEEYPKGIGFGKVISLVYLAEPIGGKLMGSKDGKDVSFFKKTPKNTIKFQKEILSEYVNMRN